MGSQYRMIAVVFGSGAAAGLVAWVLQAATGGRLFPFPWYASVLAALFLGGVAAGIGVYVLASINLKQAGPAIFFAVLCGMFFQPVFKAGSDFVRGAILQAKVQSQLSDVQRSTQQLSQAVTTQPPQQVQAALQKTAETTANLVQQSASVPDGTLKTELLNKSTKAVDTIAAAAPKAPDPSVTGLYQIGLAAKQADQTKLTLHVLDSL